MIILDLAGRLTYSAGLEMGERLQVLSAHGPEHVLLNLQDVSYIDSAGLGAMVEAFTQREEPGWRAEIPEPDRAHTPPPRGITGLTTIVSLFDDERSAVASFVAA